MTVQSLKNLTLSQNGMLTFVNIPKCNILISTLAVSIHVSLLLFDVKFSHRITYTNPHANILRLLRKAECGY